MATPWRTAWITGASTGIGRALALELASHGVKVAASARSSDKLGELAGLAAGIAPLPLNVNDRSAIANAVRTIDATLGPIDLAVLNAGIWQPMTVKTFSAETAARSMAINYLGVVNGIEAVLPGMLERGRGHIAVMASIAGYRGMPLTAAYGPPKAALINLAETLRNQLIERGIRISVINPGYVATPMTSVNKFPMPFLISAEDAARRIVRGLQKGRFEIAFPWQLIAMAKLGRVLPYPLYFWYARTFLSPPRKK
jgi:NAD(P)-dependent dehydrogenase (short-subunit alcohol dehydrogenase family)